MLVLNFTFKGSCHLCPNLFFTSDHEMHKHFVASHKTENGFCCDVAECSKHFGKWGEFVRHMGPHYPQHYKVFHCSESACKYKTSQKAHLKSHMSRKHRTQLQQTQQQLSLSSIAGVVGGNDYNNNIIRKSNQTTTANTNNTTENVTCNSATNINTNRHKTNNDDNISSNMSNQPTTNKIPKFIDIRWMYWSTNHISWHEFCQSVFVILSKSYADNDNKTSA